MSSCPRAEDSGGHGRWGTRALTPPGTLTSFCLPTTPSLALPDRWVKAPTTALTGEGTGGTGPQVRVTPSGETPPAL